MRIYAALSYGCPFILFSWIEDSKPSIQAEIPSHEVDDDENSLESPLTEASRPQGSGVAMAGSSTTTTRRPLYQHVRPAGSPTVLTALSVANIPVSSKCFSVHAVLT